jgi:hypothetical protein
MHSLPEILQLEEQQELEPAFHAYVALYVQHPTVYPVWRHFYFFLWAALDEAPGELVERLGVSAYLRKLLGEGESRFATQADFCFLAGYTIAILPYEFGPFEEWERKGKDLLRQATALDPENPLYQLAYLGSLPSSTSSEWSPAYRQAVMDTAPLVGRTFQGDGLLNRYFREVLYRVDRL